VQADRREEAATAPSELGEQQPGNGREGHSCQDRREQPRTAGCAISLDRRIGAREVQRRQDVPQPEEHRGHRRGGSDPEVTSQQPPQHTTECTLLEHDRRQGDGHEREVERGCWSYLVAGVAEPPTGERQDDRDGVADPHDRGRNRGVPGATTHRLRRQTEIPPGEPGSTAE
jgi:hypothetical protein